MAALFGGGGDNGAREDAKKSQATQREAQGRQNRRVQEDEGMQQREIGARRRLINARATGGNSGTLFGSPAGVSPTLGG